MIRLTSHRVDLVDGQPQREGVEAAVQLVEHVKYGTGLYDV